MDYKIKALQKILVSKKLISLIVTKPANIFYLTGFMGLSPTEREVILIIGSKPTLITAQLYQKEAEDVKNKSLDIFIAKERYEIKNQIKTLLRGAKRIGFEAQDLTYQEYKEFSKFTSKLKPTKDLVEELRIVKSPDEVKKIEKAQTIAQKSFLDLVKTLKAGQTELEIMDRLTTILKANGSHQLAFESIVASGPNSGLPHYKTGTRKLVKGEILLLDFGGKYHNYCADLTRVVFVGKPTDQARNIYDLVYKAQSSAIAQIKKGVKAKLVNKNAISTFKQEKLHDHFIHSLGHGIGLEVHEKPSLSKISKDTLINGMVFSVEPGLYFDWGGVRIEDLVTLKEGEAKILGKRAPFITV